MHQANMAKASMPGLAQGIGYVAGSIEQAQAEAELKKQQEEQKRSALESGWTESFDSVVARRDFEQGPYFDQWKLIEEENKALFLEAETNSERFDILKDQRARSAAMAEMKGVIQQAQGGLELTSTNGLTDEEMELWQHINSGDGVSLNSTDENDVVLSYNGKTYTSTDIDKIIAKSTRAVEAQLGSSEIMEEMYQLGMQDNVGPGHYREDKIKNRFMGIVTPNNQRQLLKDDGVIVGGTIADALLKHPELNAPIAITTNVNLSDGKVAEDGRIDQVEWTTLSEEDKKAVIELLGEPENLNLFKRLVGDLGNKMAKREFDNAYTARTGQTTTDSTTTPSEEGSLDPES